MADKSILLVEDDPLVSSLYQHVLLDAGYSVHPAASLGQAWASLRKHSYALVIGDWKLPDGDGVPLLDTVAQLGAKTLFMSGYLLKLPRRQARMHPVLMKPVRPDEMLAAVEEQIGAA